MPRKKSKSPEPPEASKPPELPQPGKPFDPLILGKTVIAIPLLETLRKENEPGGTPGIHRVIIDLNLEYLGRHSDNGVEYPSGRDGARAWVMANVEKAKEAIRLQSGLLDGTQAVDEEKSKKTNQYLFAALEGRVIQLLVRLDAQQAIGPAQATDTTTQAAPVQRIPSRPRTSYRAIYHIWPDFEVTALINKSVATVKADAARNSFGAGGADIVWAVMDSGINAGHNHFRLHQNIEPGPFHHDFTVADATADPFKDDNGHGTHVAGIIAGEQVGTNGQTFQAVYRFRNETGDITADTLELQAISGMAPKCKLVSLKVLDANGKGPVSNLIAAIAHIQEINGYGRRLLIHGVNLSVGYNFEPEWFACGQSPLCVEVDRLVKSGVVVVVAAGNTGYGVLTSTMGVTKAGMDLTINDPGNADLAITVGSTHRDMPHVYGVSYFSSKGPTGDGRLKPDLVAPGEKIISCATGKLKEEGAQGQQCEYVETSGTSMAAPHVSGVIAAFLSVRREFIGRPENVKEIFLSTATDLKRERYFQGSGLVDLMRAIQSV
jgi:serine protease AprX